MRFFNTAGPCFAGQHYMLPPVERLPRAIDLIDRGLYFVVHAPRQTGKSTTLMALAKRLTDEGRYAALHFSCETGKVAGDDHVAGQRAVLRAMRQRAMDELPTSLWPPEPWPAYDDAHLLSDGLRTWAQACPRPLVLLFDEIDALRGDTLVSVLSQLRDRYVARPQGAAWSVVLCGLRDVRDYKAAGGGDPSRLGTSSPFNIKVESMRLGDFDADEVAALYRQHTEDTGQPFTDEAVARAFALTAGQPWLVNALANEITRKMDIQPPTPITAEHVEAAKERLILARATHLDSLVARLHEDRVRRILEPVLAGGYAGEISYDDDVSYVRDLGLIAASRPLRVANPMYREIIARVLSAQVEDAITPPGARFIGADGRIDMDLVLRSFAEFWRQHGEVLTGTLPYHEVAPQLVLMAYLQSIVNGTGSIDREYGIGRGRIDLCVRWPHPGPGGERRVQREAIELKVWRDRQADPLAQGTAELDDYLDGLGLDTGVLVIFDRRHDRPGARATGDEHAGRVPAEVALSRTTSPRGRPITLLRA
ncbi:AAA family ATPase [Haliangium sp.]|uniref:AAA family ATPase n=1 Tax=Haliangium sp. TaxID=2663208 RepID=UPI003D12494D